VVRLRSSELRRDNLRASNVIQRLRDLLGNQKLALKVGDRVEGVLDNDFEFVPA